MGRTEPLFFRSTSDSCTARLASARCSGAPSRSSRPATEDGLSKRPALNLTLRMRRTASSSRLIGTRPSRTSSTRLSNRVFQASGTMYMSSPAFSAAGQSPTEQPGSCPCAFQSPTTKPSKPIRPLSTSVSKVELAVFFSPFQLEKEAITVMIPASSAGGYPPSCTRISSCSDSRASPWSLPPSVPPSARKCLAEPTI